MKALNLAIVMGFAFGNGAAFAVIEPIQYFTDRAAWEEALGGMAVVEDFDDIPTRLQLHTGVNEIGQLSIEVERVSGNLIVEGSWPSTVNGTNSWRIEAATQSGGTPPVTPEVVFDRPVVGFGADFYFPSWPRATMNVSGETIHFSDHVSGLSFFGVIDPGGFDSVEFDVVSPINTIFHADNVGYYEVPEPSSIILLLLCVCGGSRSGKNCRH